MIGITNVVNKKVSDVERINLTLQTDQYSHEVLHGVAFTLSYGTYSKIFTWDGRDITIEVPAHVIYTITFGDVKDYTTPFAITYIAIAGNSRTVKAVYTIQGETLTVKCEGLSSGFTLTVKNADTGATIGSQTITSKSYQIPAGTRYYVTASTVNDYTKPENSETYTAVANGTRTVTMTYTPQDLGEDSPGFDSGVWIVSTEGKYYTERTWNPNKTANHIYVKERGRGSVFIALTDCSDKLYGWSAAYRLEDIVTTEDQSEAESDWQGYENSYTLLRSGVGAANVCDDYYFPNGETGYLGSGGEWRMVIDNLDWINECLDICGGDRISKDFYCTSTQFDAENFWLADISIGQLTPQHKRDGGYLRAFLY